MPSKLKWASRVRARSKADLRTLTEMANPPLAQDETAAARRCLIATNSLEVRGDLHTDVLAAISVAFVVATTFAFAVNTPHEWMRSVIGNTHITEFEALLACALIGLFVSVFLMVGLLRLLDTLFELRGPIGIAILTSITILASVGVARLAAFDPRTNYFLQMTKVVVLCASVASLALILPLAATAPLHRIATRKRERPFLNHIIAQNVFKAWRELHLRRPHSATLRSVRFALRTLEAGARTIEIDVPRALQVGHPLADAQLAESMARKASYIRSLTTLVVDGRESAYREFAEAARKLFTSTSQQQLAEIPEVNLTGPADHELRRVRRSQIWSCFVMCFPAVIAILYVVAFPSSLPPAALPWIIPISALWIFVALWTTVDPHATDRMDGVKKIRDTLQSLTGRD